MGFVRAHAADAETEWSIGSFGAIAEFGCDSGEDADVGERCGVFMVATARVGVRIASDGGDAARRLRATDQGKLEPAGRAGPA